MAGCRADTVYVVAARRIAGGRSDGVSTSDRRWRSRNADFGVRADGIRRRRRWLESAAS